VSGAGFCGAGLSSTDFSRVDFSAADAWGLGIASVRRQCGHWTVRPKCSLSMRHGLPHALLGQRTTIAIGNLRAGWARTRQVGNLIRSFERRPSRERCKEDTRPSLSLWRHMVSGPSFSPRPRSGRVFGSSFALDAPGSVTLASTQAAPLLLFWDVPGLSL